jgi:hypothetical protein
MFFSNSRAKVMHSSSETGDAAILLASGGAIAGLGTVVAGFFVIEGAAGLLPHPSPSVISATIFN